MAVSRRRAVVVFSLSAWAVSACGGRSALDEFELMAGTGPALGGVGGALSSGGGSVGGRVGGSAGTVASAGHSGSTSALAGNGGTAGTGVAGNAGTGVAGNGGTGAAGNGGESGRGGAGGGPPVDRVLYVDPMEGSDANPGTRARPFKTISHAAADSSNGTVIDLLDGTYDYETEPQFRDTTLSECGVGSGIVIPSGVTLRADHSGQAVLVTAGYHGLCFFGGRVEGLRIGRTAFGGGVIEIDRGELEIHETAFWDDFQLSGVGSPNPGSIHATGSAKVSLFAGQLQGYAAGSNFRLALLEDQAELTVNQGELRLTEPYTPPGTNSAFYLSDSSRLTLHGVALIDERTDHGHGVILTGSSGAVLDQGTTLTGFSNAISILGPTSLSVNNVTFSHNQTGIFVFGTKADVPASVVVRNSSFSEQESGIWGLAAGLDLDLSHTRFEDLRGTAISLLGSGRSVFGSITILRCGYGMRFIPRTPELELSIFMRNSSVRDCRQGVWILSNNGQIDLGTLSSPGNNELIANHDDQAGTGANLTFAGKSLFQAVGNRWDPLTQGSDASGRFSVLGNTKSLDVTAGSGPNYSVGSSESTATLRLAEIP